MPILATTGRAGSGKDTVADFLEEQARARGQHVVRLKFAGALREDLIAGAKPVQVFWHELNRALTAPDHHFAHYPLDAPLHSQEFWSRCLPTFKALRERARKVVAVGLPGPTPWKLPAVPTDIINTDDRIIKENPHAACGGLSPRALMQAYGSYMRNAVDEGYWVGRLAERVKRIQEGDPDALIIITDLRYENEAQFVREAGGLIIHVARTNSENALQGEAAQHESEVLVALRLGDVAILNEETLERLREATKCILSGEDHPLLARRTLWGTPQTLASAFTVLQASGGLGALAQSASAADLLKNNERLLITPANQIAIAAPQAPLEMENLLEYSRRIAEHSPMGTALQVLADRIAGGEAEACDAFGAVSACSGVAERAGWDSSGYTNPNILQGDIDAVIERAVFCQAVTHEDVEQATNALVSMLSAFHTQPDRDWCAQLAQDVIAQPLRKCAHEPFDGAAQWLQRPAEDGWNTPVYLTPRASAAITALLHFEPDEAVAEAAVRTILEQGDDLLYSPQEPQESHLAFH